MELHTTQLAFGKLNLTLDVLCRRGDGYHDMEMVMQSVSLCDTVDITVEDEAEKGIKVDISKENLPRDLHNLAGKAAMAFLDYVDRSNLNVSIYITKRIPDRAGMAGGSSDAAAVIRGLDSLLGTGLAESELSSIALSVGSDVPYCLRGGTALARGRGELLKELPPMPACGILLVKPTFSVSTPALFAALDKSPITARPDTGAAVRALECGDLRALCGNLVNVFEEALPESERRLVESIKSSLLDAGALGACMTGTGSVVFGVFPTVEDAARADLSRFGNTFVVSPEKKL